MYEVAKAVTMAMAAFVEEYPGRFVVSASRKKIWQHLLSDLEPGIIMATAYHLLSARKEFPPDVALFRETAILLGEGRTEIKGAEEAWGDVMERVYGNSDRKLCAKTMAALKQTSTINDLKQSRNIAADRAHFVRAYNKLEQKDLTQKLILPDVKRKILEPAKKRLTKVTASPGAVELLESAGMKVPEDFKSGKE